MSASVSQARKREAADTPSRGRGIPPSQASRRMVIPEEGPWPAGSGPRYSLVDLGDSARMALMLAPQGRGSFREQAHEVLRAMASILEKQAEPMVVTVQTVFLRDGRDQEECERILAAFHGEKRPVVNFVIQPPCCGAALTVEAWAIGGDSVRVEYCSPQVLAVGYDGVRWVYCAGIRPADSSLDVYEAARDALARMRAGLAEAGSCFEHVVRTWFYLGGITQVEGGGQRYQELNRSRTDVYGGIRFRGSPPARSNSYGAYPASTGIGMGGAGLVVSCLALETRREDIRLVALENPQQTPAYVYNSKYSPLSPKFSRAMALVLGDYLTTWVSGTASIVGSETRHLGDVEKQTEQTIENIERLIAGDNFLRHGVKGAGASVRDLAKVRVYLKRPEDFAKCKAVCERRFGPVPAIYAVADVCRPELLVEIEGVAFSRCAAS